MDHLHAKTGVAIAVGCYRRQKVLRLRREPIASDFFHKGQGIGVFRPVQLIWNGHGSLYLASADTAGAWREWTMRRRLETPEYATRLADLPVAAL